MGFYSKIKSQAVVESIKQAVNLDNQDFDIWLNKVVNEGARHLDGIQQFKKAVCELTIEDYKAELPSNFFQLLGLRSNCTSYIYVDIPFIQSCGCELQGTVAPYSGFFQIQDGTIFFSAVEGAEQPTTATLAYWAYDTDEDGLMVIREDFERALTAYGAWRYCQRRYIDRREPQFIELAGQFQREWIAQKRWVKSKGIANDFENTKAQVREFFRAWIVQKDIT